MNPFQGLIGHMLRTLTKNRSLQYLLAITLHNHFVYAGRLHLSSCLACSYATNLKRNAEEKVAKLRAWLDDSKPVLPSLPDGPAPIHSVAST